MSWASTCARKRRPGRRSRATRSSSPSSAPMRAILGALAFAAAVSHAASLPADRETVPRAELAALVAAPDEYPVSSGYTERVEYIDFSSYGQDFTQVVVILTPDKPRLHRGRKLVVVGGEPGSEYARDFIE